MSKRKFKNFVKKSVVSMIVVVMLFVFDIILPVSNSGSFIPGGPIYTEAATVTYYQACPNSCNSIVDGLKSIGVDSSYANRKQIASLNGYSNYTGTAAQNTNLLSLLKQGKLIKSGTYDRTRNFSHGSSSRLVYDGEYMIVCGNDSGKVLDILGWGTDDGSNLGIWSRNNETNQKFYLNYLNNGYYSIKSCWSNKYLHVSDGNNKYANVHQWSGGTHENAQWALSSAGNGYIYLRNRANGSYLDNNGGNSDPGNNVGSYPYNGTNAQRWRLVPLNSRGGFIYTVTCR